MMSEPNEAGVFGDQFGAVNALFSGLAFAGVIYAVILQSKELELQREELVLTRAELSRSAQAQEESGRFLGEQAEVMKVTAEINALASIVQSLTGQIEFLSHTKDMGSDTERIGRIIELERRRESNIQDLELLLHAVKCASEVNMHE
jgi:hypothetical protein